MDLEHEINTGHKILLVGVRSGLKKNQGGEGGIAAVEGSDPPFIYGSGKRINAQ